MDDELFELCKEVYEKTRWNDESAPLVRFEEKDSNTVAPLYTSDYLLEKLPRQIKEHYHITLQFIVLGEPFCASYDSSLDPLDTLHERFADTPLKALLKLTLALHEAGELQPASNGRELQ